MNEQKMLEEVKLLCKANGAAIDKIARDCRINQRLVAKFFMEVMQHILDQVEEDYRAQEV